MVQCFKFLFLCSQFVFSIVYANTQANINIQNDTVHLELTGQSQWKYQIDRQKNTVKLEVDPLDSKSAANLTKFKSPIVSAVKYQKGIPAGRDTLEMTLSSGNIEFFDYLTDEPSRLIIDFYVSPEAVAKEAKKAASTKKPAPSVNINPVVRKPANEFVVVDPNGPLNIENSATAKYGLFDGADPEFERFSIKDYEIKDESIIQSRDRFYIRFPWLFETPQKWQEVLKSENIYQIQPRTDDENKQMRLLEKLFSKNRNQVFLQTAEWFLSKYPESSYKEMISYMKADTRNKIFQDSKKPEDFNLAIQAYREAVSLYPKSPMAEKVSLQNAIKLYENNDYLASLRAFNQHLENSNFSKDTSLSRDLAHLGVALSYMQLKKYDESLKELEQLAATTKLQEMKEEVAYRIGDVYVESKKYPEAIQQYKLAQKNYASAQSRFPGSYYNKAEAQFWLSNYKQSLDDFKEYIKKFPSDNHAPLALTRIGETLEILGADKSRVMGAYLESYFRFGENTNALVARIRMTASRMKSMKPKEVELAVKEIFELSKKINFVDADKLATILISEGFNDRGEFDKTLGLLIDYYQQYPMMTQADQFKKRIVSTINKKMDELVTQKDFITALKTHQKYFDVWLKDSDRLDTRYYLGASFEQAGAPKDAEGYYREVLNRLMSYKGTNKEKELRVIQNLPSVETLHLRLATTLYNQKKFHEAYDSLRQIKGFEGLNEQEQIDRVSLAVNLLMEKEEYDSAKRFVVELLKTWKGEPSKMSQPYLRLAEIEIKTKKYDEAFDSLKKIDELFVDTQSSPNDTHFSSLEKRFELANQLGRSEEVISAAEKILKNYEQTKPVASVRYKWGQILAARGQMKKAEEIWAGFTGPGSDFWRNLAAENVSSESWNSDYKKYKNRIPAMSQEGAN